jgi:putative ABC transport system permease protein
MTGGWRMAVRNLRRNRRRNLATGLAIALGYASVLMLGGYHNRIEAMLRTNTVYLQRFGHLSIYRPGALERAEAKPAAYAIPAAEQATIARLLAEDPRVEFTGRYLRGTGLAGNGCKSLSVQTFGLDPEAERRIVDHPQVRRWAPELGRPVAGLPMVEALAEEGAVALSAGLAEALRKTPGHASAAPPAAALDCRSPSVDGPIRADPYVQLVALDFEGTLSATDGRVAAIYKATTYDQDMATLWTGLGTLQRLAATDGVTSFAVYLKDPRDARAVQRDLAPGLAAAGITAEVRRFDERAANPYYVGSVEMVRSVVGFIALLVAAVALLSVVNAMTLTILERTRELATFRSLGFTRGQVLGLFLREAAVITALGVAVGLALGLAAAATVNHLRIPFHPPGMAGGVPLLIVPDAALCAASAALYFPLSLAATWIAVRGRVRARVATLLTAVTG